MQLPGRPTDHALQYSWQDLHSTFVASGSSAHFYRTASRWQLFDPRTAAGSGRDQDCAGRDLADRDAVPGQSAVYVAVRPFWLCAIPACSPALMPETTAPMPFCFWNMSRPCEDAPVWSARSLRRLRYPRERAEHRHLRLRYEP